MFDLDTGEQLDYAEATDEAPYEVDLNQHRATSSSRVAFLHSHPDDSPPSERDWDNLIALPWLELYVTVSRRYTFFLSKGPTFHNPYRTSGLTQFVHRFSREVKAGEYGYLPFRHAARQMAPNEVDSVLLKVNSLMASDYGVTFVRENNNEPEADPG